LNGNAEEDILTRRKLGDITDETRNQDIRDTYRLSNHCLPEYKAGKLSTTPLISVNLSSLHFVFAVVSLLQFPWRALFSGRDKL
jgi:hypothetical protein